MGGCSRSWITRTVTGGRTISMTGRASTSPISTPRGTPRKSVVSEALHRCFLLITGPLCHKKRGVDSWRFELKISSSRGRRMSVQWEEIDLDGFSPSFLMALGKRAVGSASIRIGDIEKIYFIIPENEGAIEVIIIGDMI